MSEKAKEEKGIEVWNNVLTAALKVPGAKVNRDTYLKKELEHFYSAETVDYVIKNGLENSKVDKKVLDKIAKAVITYHTTIATGLSFAAGLPGGWWMAATIPADLAQFYAQIIIVAQKLAYIYGWGDFSSNEVSDEYRNLITLFIGVMSGAQAAEEGVKVVAEIAAKQVAKKLPQLALTKSAIYNVVKKVATFIGIKMTKDSFAKGLSKAVPIIGGVVSGTITVATFGPMSKRLQKYLSSLPIAKI